MYLEFNNYNHRFLFENRKFGEFILQILLTIEVKIILILKQFSEYLVSGLSNFKIIIKHLYFEYFLKKKKKSP